MTNQQIKDELRRSACEDINPYFGAGWIAYRKAVKFSRDAQYLEPMKADDMRIFFLLVDEALE